MTEKGTKAKKSLSLNTGISVVLSSSYWNITDRVKEMGQTPHCCGQEMFAEDDHGRFQCFHCGRRVSL